MTPLLQAKADLSDQDLLRTAARWGLPLSFNPGTHDSFLAQRLLCTVPNSDREDVASELFRAYWAQHQNIADPSVLSRFSKRSRLSDAAGANELLANTEDALKRGACCAAPFHCCSFRLTRAVSGACELPAVFVTNHALGTWRLLQQSDFLQFEDTIRFRVRMMDCRHGSRAVRGPRALRPD